MKIKLLALPFLFIPTVLMAQVHVNTPPITGILSIEQSAPKPPSTAIPGVGKNPQTLQFAVHPGTLQYDEDSAPKTVKPGATPMPAPDGVAIVNFIPTPVKPTAVGGKSDGVEIQSENRINAVDSIEESLLGDLAAISIIAPPTQAPLVLPPTPIPSAGGTSPQEKKHASHDKFKATATDK